jgi:hypothetical protein
MCFDMQYLHMFSSVWNWMCEGLLNINLFEFLWDWMRQRMYGLL